MIWARGKVEFSSEHQTEKNGRQKNLYAYVCVLQHLRERESEKSWNLRSTRARRWSVAHWKCSVCLYGMQNAIAVFISGALTSWNVRIDVEAQHKPERQNERIICEYAHISWYVDEKIQKKIRSKMKTSHHDIGYIFGCMSLRHAFYNLFFSPFNAIITFWCSQMCTQIIST